MCGFQQRHSSDETWLSVLHTGYAKEPCGFFEISIALDLVCIRLSLTTLHHGRISFKVSSRTSLTNLDNLKRIADSWLVYVYAVAITAVQMEKYKCWKCTGNACSASCRSRAVTYVIDNLCRVALCLFLNIYNRGWIILKLHYLTITRGSSVAHLVPRRKQVRWKTPT